MRSTIHPGRAASAGLLLAFFVLRLATASAAEAPDLVRPADTSSPRATLRSFIDSCNQFHQLIRTQKYLDRDSPEHRPLTRRILDCLDVSELPEYARDDLAGEAAVCLKEVLDRVELPPYEEIPDTATVYAAGAEEELLQWRIPGARITIARVQEGPRQYEYVFSAGTVDRADEYYEDVESSPYRTTGQATSPGLYQWYISAPGDPRVGALVDGLPEWTRDRILGLAAWKWAGLGIALVIAVVLMAVAYRLQRYFTHRYRETRLVPYCLTILLPIGVMLVPLAFKHVAEQYITLRSTPLYVVAFSANLAALLAALVVVFAASNRIAAAIIASPRIKPGGLDAQFTRIASKLLSLVAAVVVLLEGGRYLGIPITTLLAGAGVGGLALALAAQSGLKDLLGTIMILLDKPYRVGDRIIVKSYDGFVQEIGLRSTKVRLLTGHMASIPNDEMARADVENVGQRPHIRRMADIHIPLDTPRDKVETAVAVIRAALDEHEGMDPEFPPRVYFNDFNPDSFNIRLIYWYNPPNYWDFLAFSEKINLEIFRAFEERGIPFSLPSRITYTTTGSEQRPLEVRLSRQDDVPKRDDGHDSTRQDG